MSNEGKGVMLHRSVEVLAAKLRRRLAFNTLPRVRSLILLLILEQHRQIVGSRISALETLAVLRQVVTRARFSNFEQLVEIIRGVGRRLVEANPKGAQRFRTSSDKKA
jgi:hypothetical protein